MGTPSASSDRVVAGFVIERELGDGLWAAVQPELDRRVALRLVRPGERFDAARWPEGPGVVRLYTTVGAPEGTYVATQFIPGARTLAECARARPGRRRRWLGEVEATLEGAVHGDLTEADILIGADGRALVTGFGRAGADPTTAADRAALERLREGGRQRSVAAPVAFAVAAAAAVVIALSLSGDARPPLPAPAPSAGASAFGSELMAGTVATVDCEGFVPGGSSLPCTIVQTALPGQPLIVPFDGIVRSWSVRGARGRLHLQVLRDTPKGLVTYNRTVEVTADEPIETFRADRSVPAGARFALELAPGAGAGIRRGVADAVTARYFGPLRSTPQVTDTSGGTGEELLLRVDVVPRVRG